MIQKYLSLPVLLILAACADEGANIDTSGPDVEGAPAYVIVRETSNGQVDFASVNNSEKIQAILQGLEKGPQNTGGAQPWRDLRWQNVNQQQIVNGKYGQNYNNRDFVFMRNPGTDFRYQQAQLGQQQQQQGQQQGYPYMPQQGMPQANPYGQMPMGGMGGQGFPGMGGQGMPGQGFPGMGGQGMPGMGGDPRMMGPPPGGQGQQGGPYGLLSDNSSSLGKLPANFYGNGWAGCGRVGGYAAYGGYRRFGHCYPRAVAYGAYRGFAYQPGYYWGGGFYYYRAWRTPFWGWRGGYKYNCYRWGW